MEAVPKVPMLSFSLKQTVQKSSFSRLKQYIAEFYQEDPDTYSKEIYELETLRAASYNPPHDISGCNLIKRYYCQLHSLQNRFPIENDHQLVNFSWRDIYSSTVSQSNDLKHDMAIVLFNYGVLHSILGASINRTTEDEMKLACTHFQCAAWSFETVRKNYLMATNSDLMPELLIFMQNICFAQAQECILEKSLIDNRKSIIVAKVTAQIIDYYNSALTALLTGGEDGIVTEIIGTKLFKDWRQYVSFKVEYMSCILLLYQGQNAEEQQKMGERVILYQKSFERLENTRKESRGMDNAQQIAEALSFVGDVVEAKRKAAKNENEFIYHEEVPDISTIPTVPGANLVKGIAFNVADPTVTADDIFHRLIPIKTHESSSLYSEEKTNLLRQIRQKIELKDVELNKFMDSLNIDSLNYDTNDIKMPQALIDRCADLNAKPNAIPDLISKMSSLANICVDVEKMLKNIQELLNREEFQERDYQQTMGYRPSSHFIELNREFMKYQEAHTKAGGSNDTLHKAMELHVNNLKILSKPLADVQAAIPTCNVDIDSNILNETKILLNKVHEMRLQRDQLLLELSENIQNDDITSQLVAWGDKNIDDLFKQELTKHDKLIAIIEQNLIAQSNILKAFTDAYAKCAFFIKSVSDTKHKREQFLSSLIASYDVYDDLLGKSLKGLEFYKKLQNNIHKLCARVKSACEVQDEDRQQRLKSLNKKRSNVNVPPPSTITSTPTVSSMSNNNSTISASITTPQISTNMHHIYPDSMTATSAGVATATSTAIPKQINDYESYETYQMPLMRPTPIGQENNTMPSACGAPTINPATSYQYTMQSRAIKSSLPATTYAYDNNQTALTGNYVTNRTNVSSYDNQNLRSTMPTNDIYSANTTIPMNPYYNVNPMTSMQQSSALPSAYQNNNVENYYAPTSQQISYGNYHQNDSTLTSNIQQSQTPIDYNNASNVSTSINQPTLTSYSNYNTYNSNISQSQQMPQQLNYSNQMTNIVPTISDQQIQSQSIAAPSPSPALPSTSVAASTLNYGNVYPQQQMALNPTDNTAYADNSGMYYNNYQTIHGHQYYTDPNTSTQYAMQPSASYGSQYPTSTGNYQQYYNNVPSSSVAQSNNPNYQSMPITPQVSLSYIPPTTIIPTIPYEIPKTSVPSNPIEPKLNHKIDLMSDLDFAIPAPTLQPIKSDTILTPKKSFVKTEPIEPKESNEITEIKEIPEKSEPKPEHPKTTLVKSKEVLVHGKIAIAEVERDPKSDADDDIETTLRQMSMTDSFTKSDLSTKSNASSIADVYAASSGSASSIPINIEIFFKEVQRYEKAVNSLQTKTLNGTTPLDIKWKELNDLLAKSSGSRTVSVSKLFPEKNRSTLSVPYDHARVVLPTETDNYINAAHIKDLGARFNHFIFAEAPTFNTFKDFWNMIWSQNSTYIICLTSTEENQNYFFPKLLNIEQLYGDYAVTVLEERTKSHTIEKRIKVSSSETNTSKEISVLVAKSWSNKHSVNNIVGISQNVTDMIISGNKTQFGAVILNCSTNCERCALVALTMTCIGALESETSIIINISDFWYRVCSQRHHILNDKNLIQLSMQIVLQCCREFIKKKSLKAPSNNSQINYYFIEEEETPVKDPFKDLDPLWKMK